MLSEANLQRIQLVPLVPIGVGNHQSLDRQLLRILCVRKRRFGDRLVGILVEHRLGIEALHMADSAVHEDPDHALGLRSEVWLTSRWRPLDISEGREIFISCAPATPSAPGLSRLIARNRVAALTSNALVIPVVCAAPSQDL